MLRPGDADDGHFAELVRDEQELRGWIANGGVLRLLDDPAARFFIDRQRIQMPAYDGFLKEEQIDRIVEFGDKVRAKSLLARGQSGDPASPHFDDQAERYAKGQFKDVGYYREDVEKRAERIYHPGE